MTILLIEDEIKLVDILRKALSAEKYAVDVAMDGDEGLKKALKNQYGLIILDIMLPKKDGLEVCKTLRERSITTPIIMLTAKGTEGDRISGLDIGADDYIVKPFGLDELFARVRAVLRRPKNVDKPVFKIADLVLDTKRHEVSRAGRVVLLAPKEYRLIHALFRNMGSALTRRQLLDEVWGPEFVEANNELNVHISYLRRKIDSGHDKRLIRTVRGVGYALKEE